MPFRHPFLILVILLTGLGAHAADLVIDTDTTWTEGSYVYDAVTITAGATLTCEGVVSLQAASLTIDAGAGISADGQGWPGQQGPGAGSNQGGGAHGGAGGGNTAAIGGLVYDSATNPAEMGSGGGGGPYGAPGGAGGGALLLDISGACTINGMLTADGVESPTSGGWEGGGGAGGTIRITADSLAGSGSISADGGDAPINGHGGGGGRIFITTAGSSFAGSATAAAGSSAASNRIPAEDGTVGFFDSDDNDFTAGPTWRFQAGDGPFAYADVFIDSSLTDFEPDVSLTASGAFSVTGSSTVSVYGMNGTIDVTVHDLAVEAGSAITVDAKGWPSEQGPGAGSWMGGASHGGLGAHTDASPTGIIYGSGISPVTHGSGGGNGPNGAVGGAGGGAITFDIEGACTVNGEITADGESGTNPGVWDGGGGAGGSILISTDTLSGSGTISADGGPVNDRFAGGGGRIAVRYLSSDFTGNIHAAGGIATGTGTPGADGTVGLVDTDDNVFIAGPSWRFQANDVPFVFADIVINGSDTGIEPEVGLTASGAVSVSGSSTVGIYGDRGTIALSAGDLTVEAGSIITVDAKGWPCEQGPGAGSWMGGASHGGLGGHIDSSPTGVIYGTALSPTTHGSGGGNGPNGAVGGAGGGAIRLDIEGDCTVDGEISADGESGSNPGVWDGGGGAGGSVFISTGCLSGSGTISADGGPINDRYAGGGGRIAIHSLSSDFTGDIHADGGQPTGTGTPGENGTAGFFDTDDDDLTTGPTWHFQERDAPFEYNNVTIHGSTVLFDEGVGLVARGTVDIDGGSLLTGYDRGNFAITARELILAAGCAMDVDLQGWPADQGPGLGEPGAGAGHGGAGGTNGGFAGGQPYGSDVWPVEPGSGGGTGIYTGAGGAGGGVITLTVTDTFTLEGDLTADASHGDWSGGGGSGGSILVSAGSIEGAGSLTASGGNGGTYGGASGGAGGRIAVRFDEHAFTGSTDISGGVNGSIGEDGTERWIAAAGLHLGVPLEIDALRGVLYDFPLELAHGDADNLVVTLTPLSSTRSWTLMARYGAPPVLGTADYSTGEPNPNGVFELHIPSPSAGTLHISALTTDPTVVDPAPFRILASALDRYLAPEDLGAFAAGARFTTTLAGLGFTNGLAIHLLPGGTATPLVTFTPDDWSPISLTVTLDLAGLTPQTLDLGVEWPDGELLTIDNALRVVENATPNVSAWLTGPDVVRAGRTYTYWLEYANNSPFTIPAPQFLVSSTLDAEFSVLGGAPQTGAVQVLGGRYSIDGAVLDESGDTENLDLPTRGVQLDDMTLPPGVSRRVPVEVTLPVNQTGAFELELDLFAENGVAIDWPEFEAEVRPEDMSDEVWERIWPMLQDEIGTTWDDYANLLRSNASYLATIGRVGFNHGTLFQMELNEVLGLSPLSWLVAAVDAAAPAPGPPLELTRWYPNSMLSRLDVGPFGRGWRHTWDVTLEILPSGNVTIRQGDGSLRRFEVEPNGSFRAVNPADHGRLRAITGGFSLTEIERTVSYFDSLGRLVAIVDVAGHSVDLTYDGYGQLATVTHTSGDSLSFSYNGHGRIEQLTDHVGTVTTYFYDATGEYLEQVEGPRGTVTTFDYQPAGGTPAPDDHALIEMGCADGTHRYFEYDDHGRLAAVEIGGGLMRQTFDYDAHGRTTVTRGTSSSTFWWNEFGDLERVRDGSDREGWLHHDRSGNLTESLNPTGGRQTWDYDHQGNPVERTDELGQAWRADMEYPMSGGSLLDHLQDPAGNPRSFRVGENGNIEEIGYPDGSVEQFAVTTNQAGNQVLTWTDRVGAATTFEINAYGQVIHELWPDGAERAIGYTKRNPTSITENGQTTLLHWTEHGHLERVDYPDGSWIENDIDPVGHTTRQTTSDGQMIERLKDPATGLVTEVRVNGAAVESFSYTDEGMLAARHLSDGSEVRYAYTAGRDLPEKVTLVDSGGTPVRDWHYTYGPGDQVEQIEERVQGLVTSAEHTPTGRISRITYPDGRTVEYEYGPNGSRDAVIDDGVRTNYTVNGLGQTLSFGDTDVVWHDFGVMAAKISPFGTTTYGHRADKRINRIESPTGDVRTLDYDVFGNLREERLNGVATTHLNDPEGRPLVEYRSGARSKSYVTVDGIGILGHVDASGHAHHYIHDGVGNTRLILDRHGDVEGTVDYSAFGDEIDAAGVVDTDYLYRGIEGMRTGPELLYKGGKSVVRSIAQRSADGWNKMGRDLYDALDDGPLATYQRITDPFGIIRGTRDLVYDEACDWLVDNGFGSRGYRNARTGAARSVTGEPGPRVVGAHGLGRTPGNGGINGGGSAGATGPRLQGAAAATNHAGPRRAPAGPGPRPGGTGAAAAGFTGGRKAGPPGGRTGVGPGPGPGPGGHSAGPPGGSTGGRAGGPGAGAGRTRGTTPPPPARKRKGGKPFTVIAAFDPNEKTATLGDGPAHTVQPGEQLTYTIFFENQPTASAPAQEVFVTDELPTELDWSTFRATEIGWGTTAVALPEDTTWYRTIETVDDWRPGIGKQWLVEVSIEPDLYSGEINWSFRTLDPDTGALPVDPFAGFLPPNDDTHRGEGWVSFVCHTHPDLVEGTLVENDAEIIFDLNEAILTPVVFNTIGYPLCDPSGDGVMDAKDLAEMIRVLTEFGYSAPGFADCDHMGGETVNDLLWIVVRIHE
ncbi:MAG: DUF6531 domain-containing protein [Thermoanaerobaculales bacterium]|jgi:uncharacterized repeat protein (TIGR01451 family)|nr:DUF6531 domain-containing protein [Thermoanaerobaculales bacterium]